MTELQNMSLNLAETRESLHDAFQMIEDLEELVLLMRSKANKNREEHLFNKYFADM